jgi:hypothetical protein
LINTENWNEIQTYYNSLKEFEFKVASVQKDSSNADALINIKDKLQKLYINFDDNAIKASFAAINTNLNGSASFVRSKDTFSNCTE